MTAILKTLTALFPLWIVLGAIWAWLVPTHFNWFAPCISPALGVIMLGMGITLSSQGDRGWTRVAVYDHAAAGLGTSERIPT